MQEPARRFAGHVMIGLVACAVLLYEIAITRVLSVVIWYHFAFLAVSLAMLGLAAPGVWFALRPPSPRALRRVLLLGGAAAPCSVAVVAKAGELAPSLGGIFESFGPTLHMSGAVVVAIVLAVLVPMLLFGAAVCLLLLDAPGREIGRRYGADLLGAMLGAALAVPLMRVLPTPELVAATGLLPLAAALIGGQSRGAALAGGALLLAAVSWGAPFALRYSKVYQETELGVLYESWTPTARLTVFPRVLGERPEGEAFGWGMGSRYRPMPLEQYWIEQDGSAGTPLTHLVGTPQDLDHLDYDVTSVGYQLRPPRRVCVIGAGGGRDILTALRAGAEHVDAVELNAEMIRIANEVFAEWSGRVYELPGVHAHASEGRSFLTRTPRRYDLIQISLIDSWAATTAGAYALSENYLYTVEAMKLYWQRLAPDGLVSISRWMVAIQQMEAVRLAVLARAALAELGVEHPRRHLAVVHGGQLATLLVSRTPFDAREIARLDAIARERGFVRHWPLHPQSPARSWVSRVLRNGSGALRELGMDVSPPRDDRPFFFQMLSPFRGVDDELDQVLSVNDRAVELLRSLSLLLVAATGLLFFSPFLLARRLPRGPGFWSGSAFFTAIGLGFMWIEVPWIQQFVLYLGHPSYATTVVLAALLLGAGLGAVAAGHIAAERVVAARYLLPALLLGVQLAFSGVFAETLALPLAARVGIALGLMAPAGFAMGFAFPAGMILFGDTSKAWFWALNGAASVFAGVTSLALAMELGLDGVVWIGVAAYVAACWLLGRAPGRRGAADASPA